MFGERTKTQTTEAGRQRGLEPLLVTRVQAGELLKGMLQEHDLRLPEFDTAVGLVDVDLARQPHGAAQGEVGQGFESRVCKKRPSWPFNCCMAWFCRRWALLGPGTAPAWPFPLPPEPASSLFDFA